MAGALQRLEGETERKGSETVRGGGASGEVAGMEGHEEIRGRESTAEM